MFSAMIWNVHFVYDNDGWPSFERVAQMINDTGKFITSKAYRFNPALLGSRSKNNL